MERKTRVVFASFLVLMAVSIVFVSEAPAPPPPPNMSIVKFCTDASGPGEPINFSAVIANTGGQDLIITGCTDNPPATIDNSFPLAAIPVGGTVTITGRYIPTTNPSTDTITCTGYGAISGPTSPVTVSSNPATCSYPTGDGCTRTPGYWKNHPEEWPVDQIIIGGVTYTKDAAIAIMRMPVSNDKRVTMFKALVAAKLNVIEGADSSCILSTIAAADSWMAVYGGSSVPASSYAWKIGEPLYFRLDDYNNGLLCAPYCE